MMPTVKEFLQFRRAFVFVVFIGIFAMAARNVLDPDVWWHLKTGEWIAQHRAVPHSDPFSYTRAGQPWVAHEWLSELIIYGIFRSTGYAGLIVFFAGIISAAFVPLYLRCKTNAVIAGSVTVWGALATTVVWGVRPQIFSFLLLSLWLLILERSEKNPKILWWTLPITLVWVNLHAGFILGPAFLVLFLAVEFAEFIESLFSDRTAVSRLRWLSVTLLADLVLAALNPNGAAIFRYVLDTMRSVPMQRYITEWASPDFHSADYRAFFFLVLATFVTLAVSSRKTRLRDLLVLLAGTAAALSSVRMIPLFVLAAVPLIARATAERFPSGESRAGPARVGSRLLHAVVLLILTVFATVHTFLVIDRQPQSEAAAFPTAAVAYLQQHPPSGPIFNYYSWGGYLIFKAYPQIRVFIDGRADIYGEGLTQYGETYYLQKNWRLPLSQWKVTTVIVPPQCPLASALREMPEWSLRYEDSVSVVFFKSF
jgi:hypothetical protein